MKPSSCGGSILHLHLDLTWLNSPLNEDRILLIFLFLKQSFVLFKPKSAAASLWLKPDPRSGVKETLDSKDESDPDNHPHRHHLCHCGCGCHGPRDWQGDKHLWHEGGTPAASQNVIFIAYIDMPLSSVWKVHICQRKNNFVVWYVCVVCVSTNVLYAWFINCDFN